MVFEEYLMAVEVRWSYMEVLCEVSEENDEIHGCTVIYNGL